MIFTDSPTEVKNRKYVTRTHRRVFDIARHTSLQLVVSDCSRAFIDVLHQRASDRPRKEWWEGRPRKQIGQLCAALYEMNTVLTVT